MKYFIKIYILFISIFQSCTTTKKESNQIINWKTESKNNQFLVCESNSTKEDQLQTDLETVLNKINNERIIDSEKILFYIDATNGNITITGYNNETEETFDEKGILIRLNRLWEKEQNAYYFDEVAINSIKKVLKTKIGEQSKKNFDFFYQTEMEDAEKLQ